MVNPGFFSRLEWRKDRMIYGNLIFRLQHGMDETWELGNNCFVFYKTQALVKQYDRYFNGTRNFKAENIFELGMWDGGSAAFWFEFFQPRRDHQRHQGGNERELPEHHQPEPGPEKGHVQIEARLEKQAQ